MTSVNIGRSPNVFHANQNRMLLVIRNNNATRCFTMPTAVMPHESASQHLAK